MEAHHQMLLSPKVAESDFDLPLALDRGKLKIRGRVANLKCHGFSFALQFAHASLASARLGPQAMQIASGGCLPERKGSQAMTVLSTSLLLFLTKVLPSSRPPAGF
jgi:hypothetical protein